MCLAHTPMSFVNPVVALAPGGDSMRGCLLSIPLPMGSPNNNMVEMGDERGSRRVVGPDLVPASFPIAVLVVIPMQILMVLSAMVEKLIWN